MLEVSIKIQKNESGYTANIPEISGQQIRGKSLDSVVNEIKEMIQFYWETPGKPAPNSTGESLLDLFDEITADMTEYEIAQLPKDGAKQHDHYIYGTPKKP